MHDFESERARMVREQVAARGIVSPHVLQAMGQVPRERFVAPDFADLAYRDRPLPIEAQQSISQPYIVGLMLDRAGIAPGDQVLEIGAGSGYAAAVISRIAARVFSVERHAELARSARQRVAALGYSNLSVLQGDGTRGLPEYAPYQAIVVSAGGPGVPKVLLEQLAVGGRLVIPVGPSQKQRLLKVTRGAANEYWEQDLGGVVFVPLIGEHGWGDAHQVA
jgi:protein-L-isoaspartate(D-aspartate) O-methyltransferase